MPDAVQTSTDDEQPPRGLCAAIPAIFERVGSTQIQADGRTRKERARAAVSVAVRGSRRPRIGRGRKICVFYRNSRADRLPPYRLPEETPHA